MFQRIKASEFHLNKEIIMIKLCKIFLYNTQTEGHLALSEKEFKKGGTVPPLKTLTK